ncbi:hypothetical protein [Thiomonas sp. FB-6]|uniref:hypothetical protein n=1 Tax=Thiomonas sp. FB-6 TaxID=1158291 RepID=UPI0003670D9B|nr:hypothetical protein [Thiomonas sp. FB-6]
MIDELFTTSWGKVRIKGALDQGHADVAEAILHTGMHAAELPEGRISVVADPAEIRRVARQASGTTFQAVLEDLMRALVQIVEPEPLASVGHLIDHIDHFAKHADGSFMMAPNPLDRRERHLWTIEFGKVLCRLLEQDLWLYRDPAPIAAMRHGISQAVARHVLSHRTVPAGGWRLDGLILTVAGPIEGAALRDRRRELCGVHGDSDALRRAGVLIEDGRVYRVERKPRLMEHKPETAEHKPGVRSKSLDAAAVSGVSDSRRQRP